MAPAPNYSIVLARSGGANLTLAGGGAAYALDTDAVTLTPSGAFTLSENLNLGSLSVSGGTAITISNPIVTADVTTGSSGGITLSGSGAVALNAALTTGSTTVADTAGDQSVSSGSISVTSSGSTIIGDTNGKLTTGVASIDANTGNDSATSGTITLSASGESRLPAVDALKMCDATPTNVTAGDSATVGNITVSQAAKLSADGANRSEERRVGKECGGRCAPNHGKQNVMTTGVAGHAGGISSSSGEHVVSAKLVTATEAGES